MPGKRKNRSQVKHFVCPWCKSRLWRVGSVKHYIFYQGASEIKQNLSVSRKKATFLASKGDYIDKQKWIEEFFCTEDGKIWLSIKKQENGNIKTSIPTMHDWKRTLGTINPTLPNPSVSEYSYKMSRGCRS